MSSLSFAFRSHIHIVTPRVLSFALGNTGPRCSLLLFSPPLHMYWMATKCAPAKTCTRMGHDDPPNHIIDECTHLLCDCGTTRHTIHIHGRIGCKYAQYATTLLKTCRRGLALCTLVKHQHTLLSDISAVGSLDNLRCCCYCIWCSYTTRLLLCVMA